MPRFASKDEMRSGLPLGGIGAGKIEVLPNGLLNAFTFQNNWSRPLTGDDQYPAPLGFHFGFFSEDTGPSASAGSRRAHLLQTVPVGELPLVEEIRMEGYFPRLELEYIIPDRTTRLTLSAFSPLIPGDTKNSSLPGTSLTFEARNTSRRARRIGLLFIGRNLCGEWCIGRRNRIENGPAILEMEFSNQNSRSKEPRDGRMTYAFEKRGWDWSFMESWNGVSKNFSFNPATVRLAAWEAFERQGRLPDTRDPEPVSGENRELLGAVCATRTLRPGETVRLPLAIAWDYPHHPLGHRYRKWFKGAGQSARYLLKNRGSLRSSVDRVERAVRSLPFPDWFNDALLTNLAPFFSSSWYAADGRFAFYEAPMVCPLMGTIDVGFYGSIPLAYFFPELEISQLMQFAKAQRSDGYIPHDLGKNRIDLPSDGTTYYRWKDLNPKFTLMAYRDYLWSGDAAFLRAVYPRLKRAVRWTLAADRDGDGLPEHEGADQTFDLWEFHGPHPYTSSLHLAALLAAARSAALMGDKVFERECRAAFAKASRSFIGVFWNGAYFGEPCVLGQLNGQWYADLLGLGSITDDAKIRTALRHIQDLNNRPSAFGMINSVHADGTPDLSSEHSRNVWSGMNYAFISLAIMRGLPPSRMLTGARKLWDNITHLQKSPWNQPDTIDARTGRYVFGDSYYRNMAIWSIPIGYARHDARTAKVLRYLREGVRPTRKG